MTSGKKVGHVKSSSDCELFLGIDGGKSKTLCILAGADGRLLGWGRSGSSDKYYRPFDEAMDEVKLSVLLACQRAGLSSSQVGWGAFGLAGADWPEDFEQLRIALEKRDLACKLLVKNDMHIALRANVQIGPGVLVSAGTHLASAIRLADGREWYSGWFSVDGTGGVTAGKRAFWAVMHAADGRGQPTALTELLLESTGKATPLDLLRDLSTGRLEDEFFASLTPLIFQAYEGNGDPASAAIIEEIGEDISLWATGLLERFGLAAQAIPVVISGGLIKGDGPLLFDTIVQNVHRRCPRARVQVANREPALGALLYAYELSGVRITPELVAIMDDSFALLQESSGLSALD